MKSYFNTDKIYEHGYFPDYVKIAAELGPEAKVLELGAYTGESLRMFQSLFPLGSVTGVDHSPDAVFPKGTRKVLASQDDPALGKLGPFDLIVDDASHVGDLTAKSFKILWDRVNPGGFYVVEDWFVGIEPYRPSQQYDPAMLETVQGFLRLLTKDGNCESVLYKYGLAIVRKKAG